MPDTRMSLLTQLTGAPDPTADQVVLYDVSAAFQRRMLIEDLFTLLARTDPAAPAAGQVKLYAKNIAGRIVPKWVGPSGIDTVFQASLWGNNVVLWTPTNVAAGLWQGTAAGATGGTMARNLPTYTNLWTTVNRQSYANVVTTANQALGISSSEAMFFRSTTAGFGGFFFACRFGLTAWTANGRVFVGLAVTATPTTSNPSAAVNMCGFGIDAGDTAFTFMSNDATGAATKTAIAGQPTLAANQGYDAYIFNPPGVATIYYRLVNFNTGAEIVNASIAADLPTNHTNMLLHARAGNAALTTANAVSIAINRIYCETDQ